MIFMKTGKNQQVWKQGDLFVIPTADGRYSVGQVVVREPKLLNSVSIALFDLRFDSVGSAAVTALPKAESAFAVLFCTRDLLDSGHWKVVGNGPASIPQRMQPYEHLRGTGFVGAKVVGSANINEFVNAFYGLSPWDDWKDPQYLDRLLISSAKKPKNLLYKRAA